VHIEWKSNFGIEMSFCTFFKEIQESSPYMYAFEVCNKSVCVCEQVICDAHDRRFIKIKLREAYVLPTKIGHPSLANQNIRFEKLDYLVFLDRSY
jgi:type VI protein secretion system component Hcp